MVRQPYMTRLALGRSAYEPPEWPDDDKPREENPPQISDLQAPGDQMVRPEVEDYVQSYDVRGHPENRTSRSNARRSRRAQNDILTTVGVCYHVDKNGRLLSSAAAVSSKEQSEREKILAIAAESEFADWLAIAEVLANVLATHYVIGLRKRLQTFRFYAGVPFLDILRIERRRFGSLKYLFAGLPATLLYYTLQTCCDSGIESLQRLMISRLNTTDMSEKRRGQVEGTLYVIQQMLHILTIVTLSPIEIFAVLQQLDLIGARPLLPYPWTFPFSSLLSLQFPSIPTQWSRSSSLNFLVSVALSPIALHIGRTYIDMGVYVMLKRYVQALLPKPSPADKYSKRGHSLYLSDNDSQIANENSFTDPYSFREELRNDYLHLQEIFSTFKSYFHIPHYSAIMSQISHSPGRHSSLDQPTGPQAASAPPQHSPPILRILSTQEPRPTNPTPSAEVVSSQPSSPSTRTPSPTLSTSTTTSDPHLSPMDEYNTVQINTHTSSTDTIHMNVEVGAPVPGAPVFTSSFSASPRQTVIEEPVQTEPVVEIKYRVTELTLYPSMSLAQLIASSILNAARLPVETFLVRSIAQEFLEAASPVGPAGLGFLRGSVYPRGSWFGPGLRGGGWAGAGDYASKMTLCIGLESVVGYGVWQMAFGVAWWAGRRWYSWGRI